MGVLANHVPSIEQLKPGLVEVIEETGGSKQFFRTSTHKGRPWRIAAVSRGWGPWDISD
jgi:F-type H+-transporting ATPase subunit delta